MADYANPFGTISQSGASQDVKANALFDALSPAACYGLNGATTSGITLGLHGGKVLIAGVVTTIAATTLTLTGSATNYVQAHPDTGAASTNTTGFTPGYLPIATVTTNSTGIVPSTGFVDQRCSYVLNATLVKALSDANTTLTQPEAANSTLTFTGTLTATRDIVVPLVGKRQWTVYNGTGQSLRFIGASGTGITVATVKHAIVRSDGTNIVRVTADT